MPRWLDSLTLFVVAVNLACKIEVVEQLNDHEQKHGEDYNHLQKDHGLLRRYLPANENKPGQQKSYRFMIQNSDANQFKNEGENTKNQHQVKNELKNGETDENQEI